MSASAHRSSGTGYHLDPISPQTLQRLCSSLTPEQVRITQSSGTEAPFCGGLLDQKRSGLYLCIVCGLPLFSDEAKFESGSGWPSFHSAFDPEHVNRIVDHSHGMIRTEICCQRCDAHLGHVFLDGPPPTGERHCLNSDSLRFVPDRSGRPLESPPTGFRRGYFAGGGFNGLLSAFTPLVGVVDVACGYQGGRVDAPTEQQFRAGETGHAPSVEVIYNPQEVGYRQLLEHFFEMLQSAAAGQPGSNLETHPRSVVFYLVDEERVEAEALLAARVDRGRNESTTEIEIIPATTFWPAEAPQLDDRA